MMDEADEATLWKLLPENVGGMILHDVFEMAEIHPLMDDEDGTISRMVLRAMRMTVAAVLAKQGE
jgi:hypothetical protein